MSRAKWAAVLVVLVWAVAAAMGPACSGGQKAAAPAAPAASDLSALARQAKLAVGVLVTFDAHGKPLSQGTAFFVRADGVGLTCYHVLSDATSALVRLENGAFFPVEGKLAADPVRDLALFKVTGKDIPTVSLGDSSTLAAGQRLVAVTAPQGLGSTVADGIVSAMRELPSGSIVQVTVPLSPGSSGGPIFDLSGRVVAVAAAVLTEGQALNFAIPINAAKRLLAQPGRPTPLAPAKQPADLEDWLRQRPPSPSGASSYDRWLRGMDAILNGRYQEAVGHLRAALALDPTRYLAHCCLGAAYDKLGRRQEALEAFKEAIRLKPDYAEAHYNLGVAYDKLGRHQEALEAHQQAVRLKPDDAEVQHGLGCAYAALDRWQEALEAFKEAIRLKPDYAEAHHNLGAAYDKLGRYEEEVAFCKDAIRLKPDLAEAHMNLGAAYSHLGRHQEAVEALKQAIRLKPDLAEAHMSLGWTYCALGRYQEGADASTEAIRLKPDYAEAHHTLGWAYSNLHRWQEALEAQKQAIRLKPDYAEAHFMLGVDYSALGDRGAALEEYRILKGLDADLAGELFKLLYP